MNYIIYPRNQAGPSPSHPFSLPAVICYWYEATKGQERRLQAQITLAFPRSRVEHGHPTIVIALAVFRMRQFNRSRRNPTKSSSGEEIAANHPASRWSRLPALV